MYKINTEVVSSKLGDQIIVLNIETGKYYQLDGTSAYIWNLLEDPKTKEQLKEEIEKRRQNKDIWLPNGNRSRVITKALRSYAAFASSADKGGYRDVP